MAGTNTCPYSVRQLSREEDDLIKKHYSKHQNEFLRIGEPGYLLPALYQEHAAQVRNMPLRNTDTFIVAFPRSGTTWSQELVWLIGNDLDFDTAKTIQLSKRVPFLEIFSFLNTSMKNNILASNNNDPELHKLLEAVGRPATEYLANAPSPRFIKSHLPISLLPAGVLDTTKLVYVARDPRDVIVSSYYFYKMNVFLDFDGELGDYFDMFIKDLTPWGPYFKHIKEAWSLRHHPNLLFLFYEDLSKDLNSTARRVAQFLGKQYTDAQYTSLCEFLSFDNFKQSVAINVETNKYFFKENNFIRRGKAGGWRDYFDEELTRRAEKWIEENTRDTDLRFPRIQSDVI